MKVPSFGRGDGLGSDPDGTNGGGSTRSSFAAGGERKRLIAPRGKATAGPTRMSRGASGTNAAPMVSAAGVGARPKVLRSPGSSWSKGNTGGGGSNGSSENNSPRQSWGKGE